MFIFDNVVKVIMDVKYGFTKNGIREECKWDSVKKRRVCPRHVKHFDNFSSNVGFTNVQLIDSEELNDNVNMDFDVYEKNMEHERVALVQMSEKPWQEQVEFAGLPSVQASWWVLNRHYLPEKLKDSDLHDLYNNVVKTVNVVEATGSGGVFSDYTVNLAREVKSLLEKSKETDAGKVLEMVPQVHDGSKSFVLKDNPSAEYVKLQNDNGLVKVLPDEAYVWGLPKNVDMLLSNVWGDGVSNVQVSESFNVEVNKRFKRDSVLVKRKSPDEKGFLKKLFG